MTAPIPAAAARTRTRPTAAISTSRETSVRGESIEKVENTDKVDVSLENIRNPAYVMIKGGLTKNIGNFESVRVDVSVSMPCAPNDQAILETYGKVSLMVDDLITREQAIALGLPEGATDHPAQI